MEAVDLGANEGERERREGVVRSYRGESAQQKKCRIKNKIGISDGQKMQLGFSTI